MSERRRYVTVCDGPPHRLDARIERLYCDLRRLVNTRKRDRMRDIGIERMYTDATRAKMAAAARARWNRMTPAQRERQVARLCARAA